MSLYSLAAIAMMVALELGVAIVPDNSIPDSVRERLAVIPLDAPPTFRRIALVTKKKNRSSGRPPPDPLMLFSRPGSSAPR